MDNQMTGIDSAGAAAADARWAAWVANGVEQDKTTRKRAIGALVAAAAGFALWLAIILLG
jgi:hypothetical protein